MIPDTERMLALRAAHEVSMLETVILHTEDLSDTAKASALARLQRVRDAINAFKARYAGPGAKPYVVQSRNSSGGSDG